MCIFQSHKNVKWVTRSAMNHLVADLVADKKFFVTSGSLNTTRIMTLHEDVRVGKYYAEAVSEFEHSYDIVKPMECCPFTTYNDFYPRYTSEMSKSGKHEADQYAKSMCLTMRNFCFDMLVCPRLTQFITMGTHWPVSSKVFSSLLPTSRMTSSVWEIDMNNAYTQHSAVDPKFYVGFLGKITQFAFCDNAVLLDPTVVGIFHVPKFDDSSVSTFWRKFFSRWPLFVDNNIYSTPLLLFAKHVGYKFGVDYGCWGIPYTFEFPAYMYERDITSQEDGKGPRHYAKYTGCMGRSSTESQMYRFYGCSKYINVLIKHIAQMDNIDERDKIKIWTHPSDPDLVTMRTTPSKSVGTPHFSAFVTSYMVLNMLCQVGNIHDVDDILRVNCDALVLSTYHYKRAEDIPLTRRVQYKDEFDGPKRNTIWKINKLSRHVAFDQADLPSGMPMVSNLYYKEDSTFVSFQDMRKIRRMVAQSKAMQSGGANQYLVPLDNLGDLDLSSVTEHDLSKFVVIDSINGDNAIMNNDDTLELLMGIQQSLRKHADTQRKLDELRETNHRETFAGCMPVETKYHNRNIIDEQTVFYPHKVALLGPGGTGKTTSILSNPRFINVYYVTLMHCLGAEMRKRQENNDDDLVTNLKGSEVLGMMAKTPRGAERRTSFLRLASTCILDEISQLSMDELLHFISFCGNKVQIFLCGDLGYQTPPIRYDRVKNIPGEGHGYVSNPFGEADEMALLSLNFNVHMFDKHSYRQHEGDPILDFLRHMREDMFDMLHGVSDRREYAAKSKMLAEKYCALLEALPDQQISIDDMVKDIKVDDVVLTYTNSSKDDITSLIEEKRVFEDPDNPGKHLKKWYIRTNNFLSKGYSNGMVIIRNECPLKFRTPTVLENDEARAHQAKYKNRKRKYNKKQKNDDDEENPRKKYKPSKYTKAGDLRIRINGHKRGCAPVVVRWAFTVHSFQGCTVSHPNTVYLDTYRMDCIRVLYTLLSRVERFSQIKVTKNHRMEEMIASGDYVKGYIYMITSKDPANKNYYIGHTFSKKVKGRLNTHRSQYAAFMSMWENTLHLDDEGKIIPFEKISRKNISDMGLTKWCSCFHVLHPDPNNVEIVTLETVTFPGSMPQTEIRREIEGLEYEYFNNYKTVSMTNVLSVEANS